VAQLVVQHLGHVGVEGDPLRVGGGQDPLAISIPYNVLFKKLKAGRFLSTLYNMKVEGEEDVRVICRDVQRDVVKDLPTHVDFLRLKRTTKINLFIPVEFTGEDDAPGLKRGGVLTVVRPEIELIVTAGDIPEFVSVSLEGLDINDYSRGKIDASAAELAAERDAVAALDLI